MSLMRGYGENLALQDWLNKKIFLFEDKLSGEAVYWGTLLSYAESLRFGIVSSSEMYYFMDDMVKAAIDLSLIHISWSSLTNSRLISTAA